MTGRTALFALLGGGAGFGLLLLATGLRPTDDRDRPRRVRGAALSAVRLRRTLVAASAAVLVLVVTLHYFHRLARAGKPAAAPAVAPTADPHPR